MRTFSIIKGVPVLTLNDGEIIGKVIDILFDETKVVGLLIDKKGWLNHHLFVPLNNIKAIGQDALVIEDEKELTVYDKQKHLQFFSLFNGPKRIVGKTIMTTEGETMGLVEDVYFHEKTGNIVGYEVTDGFIADIREGKRVLKTSFPLTIGEDVLVIELN